MKFAHIADCHIGSWRDPKLSNLSTEAFEKAIDISIEKNVDFVVIAGDLFNTSLPGIDKLKQTTTKLKQLQEKNIPVYLIAGSHDFSPSGKTMLDVLENAGLVKNVAKADIEDGKLKLKFTVDKKTGTKLTGLIGRAGTLEKSFYENLIRDNLENEEGYKIFLFHSLLTELSPKQFEKVDSLPLSLLPKNFNYYAGGHPHFVYSQKHEGYGRIAYTGPLFPNSFKEIEDLHNGGFYIIEDDKTEFIPVKLYDVESINLDCNHKTPEQVEKMFEEIIEKTDFTDKIVTIRLFGVLEVGKPSDINFRLIFEKIKEKNAYTILKNSSKLSSKEFEEVKIDFSNQDEIEEKLINEHISSDDMENAIQLSKSLLSSLDTQKQEGETITTFEKRLIEELNKTLNS